MSGHLFTDIRVPIEQDNPSTMRHEERCIRYGQCRQVRRDMTEVEGHYQIWKTGGTTICIHCSQCANVCPVDCIMEAPERQKARETIDGRDSTVVFSASPSVRVALGESFEMEPEDSMQDKMVALLRAPGADYMPDTNFPIDLTIMEEANELIRRTQSDNIPIPQLTSCCPAWMKFVEAFYPEFKESLSTSKNPAGMQGPTIEAHFAKKQGLDPRRIVNMAVMPYTAKKLEIHGERMCGAGRELGTPGMRDIDYATTTRGLAEWAKSRGIDFTRLKPERYDSLMGGVPGAGVIFGNTGGTMETTVRTVYVVFTGEPVPENLLKLEAVRDMEGIREASLTINDVKLDIVVVYGTANARTLLDKIKAGEKFYQFIGVVICPGGYIGGGGQPKNILAGGDEIKRKRISGLYRKDESMKLHLSHENPEIIQAYDEFYGTSGSKKVERMLHTAYVDGSGNLDQR